MENFVGIINWLMDSFFFLYQHYTNYQGSQVNKNLFSFLRLWKDLKRGEMSFNSSKTCWHFEVHSKLETFFKVLKNGKQCSLQKINLLRVATLPNSFCISFIVREGVIFIIFFDFIRIRLNTPVANQESQKLSSFYGKSTLWRIQLYLMVLKIREDFL